MKRDNVNYLLVGSFVLLMGAVLLYALYRITGNSAKGEQYLTHFVNVAGIKEGSVVTYEGYEVGNVARIEPVVRERRTVYRLTLSFRNPPKIPVDSQAQIATPGLLSAPLVEIREGVGSEILAPGGEIRGAPRVDLMAAMAGLASDLARLTETSIRPLLATINQNMAPAMSDLRSTIERINHAAGRVDTLFSEKNVAHWSSLLQNADSASANAIKLTADFAGVRSEMEALIRDSRGLVGDSRALVSGNEKELKEVLRRVDTTLYQLESAGRHLNEFSRTIRENPGALLNSRPPVDTAGVPK